MSGKYEKYRKNMFLALKTAYMYRENFLISVVMRFIVVLLTLYLWKAVYAGRDALGDYSFLEMILYLFLANFIYGLGNFDDFSYELVDSILQGKLNSALLRPVSYSRMAFFECVGQKLVYAPIDFLAYVIPLGAAAVYGGWRLRMGSAAWCMLLLTSAGGVLMGFLISFLMGMIAFYVENPRVLIFIKGELFGLLSGSLIPLDLFPKGVRAFLELLPVKYIGYYQSSILLGHMRLEECVFDLALLTVWILFLMLLIRRLWRLALTKYIANGG